jgi:hypothetical protein
MSKRKIERASTLADRSEIGGEFHWMGLPRAPFVPWPKDARWYLLGRHALVALLQAFPPASRRLWVPSYFCFAVSDYWRSFIEVISYRAYPQCAEPEWSTLQPTADDVVIAVNFFGINSGDVWRSWRESNQCILVEDHSHDPVSGWALRSNADYAFASLRKTLPVPDGGILWSPRGLSLPPSGTDESGASTLKLAAMLWKREYLAGNSSLEAKSTYREWQQSGEHAFDTSTISFATHLSQQYVSSGVPVEWRNRRVENARRLLSALNGNREFQPIFEEWPQDAAPLGVVLEFDSHKQRDAIRLRLQENKIYCPVHWPPTATCEPTARDLADRLLTLPTDQRYGSQEMTDLSAALEDASRLRSR